MGSQDSIIVFIEVQRTKFFGECSRLMKIGQPKYRPLTTLMILLAFFANPFLDSMSCDDFARGSPCPGGGIEIPCQHFMSGNGTKSENDVQPNRQPSSDHGTVHHFCPICFTIDKSACSYDIGVPLTVVPFKLQPYHLVVSQIDSSVYKPPQN